MSKDGLEDLRKLCDNSPTYSIIWDSWEDSVSPLMKWAVEEIERLRQELVVAERKMASLMIVPEFFKE